MKMIALALTMLCSASVFAADVTMDVLPQSPVVITSARKIGQIEVQGPWFESRYLVKNDSTSTITIVGLSLKAVSVEGVTAQSRIGLERPVEVEPGQSIQVMNIVMGELPVSQSFSYRSDAKLLGWYGTNATPGAPLNVIVNFVTQ